MLQTHLVRRCTAGLALFAIGLVAAMPAAHAASDADASLDAALTALVAAKGGPPGVVVAVQRGEAFALHTAGVADTATGAAPQADDHVRLASVAKAFSGAAAIATVAQGKLALDDTIGERLPGQPAAWADITLAQLLNHTSGIPDFSKSKAFLEALKASLLVPVPPAELLAYVADDPLAFTPGAKYHYSNSDNIAVGLMVQAATGLPYEQVLQDSVYAPLGMTGTSLPSDQLLPTPFVHGYDVSQPGAPEDASEVFAAGWTWASGGIVSTPADATKFVRGYVSGKLTNPATHDAQLTFIKGGKSEPPGPGANSAGLAVFKYRTRCGTVFGHTGNTPGYTAFVASTEDGTRSATVSVNSQITPDRSPKVFRSLRNVFELAVCAALSDG
jgi:D-alanyl-D-alanine carboxypeptidase